MRLPIKTLCLLALTSFVALAARAQETLPADVYADSRSRLPSLGSEAPAGVAGLIAHGSGALVRWEFALGRALSELAVLTTAREWDQPYEWSLHELEALAVGQEPLL
jgi:4-carboxymuconolactone decarboxylase